MIVTAVRQPADVVSTSRSAWLVVAAWTVPALLATFETVMFARLGGRPIELWRAFATEAPGWYVWAGFTPVIARLATRAPLVRPLRWRNVALHLCCCVVVSLAASAVWAVLGTSLRLGPSGFLVALRNWFVSGLPFTVLVYAAVIGATSGVASALRTGAVLDEPVGSFTLEPTANLGRATRDRCALASERRAVGHHFGIHSFSRSGAGVVSWRRARELDRAA